MKNSTDTPTHELDFEQQVADIIPALNTAFILLDDGVHLATQCSLRVVKASVNRSTTRFPFNLIRDDVKPTHALGFVFGINPTLRN